MIRISDNGDLQPLPFDNDPEMVKWAEYGIAQLKAQIKAQNAARAEYEQAERDYHFHNPTLDGQS